MKLSEGEEATRAGKSYNMRSIKTWKAPSIKQGAQFELEQMRATYSACENLTKFKHPIT
jgi:hypothetical protein